jgi:CheY-like chemotaxis protein
LLEISQLDTGTMRPERTDFSAGELLAQLELEFAPLARAKGLELVFVSSRRVIRSDKRLLRRMLQNLVSNAIKYTKTGKVLVGCRRSREGLRFEVWDTGHGIPASQHEAIFREFHRLERGMREARGAGLGLSIVERISKVLGHRVTIRSEEGRGSVFSLEVPYGTASVEATAPPRPAAAPAPLADLAVLCIDNEPDVLEGMRTLLSHWGCRPMTALDCEAALDLVTTYGPPDAILADYHLDRGDGLAAVERIRALVDRPVPAVLLTADSGRPLRQAARALDIQVLPKPVKPAALRALLALVRTPRIAAE